MEGVKRGEIWVGNLNPSRGREIGKIRPALIVQANSLTKADTGTIVVLPLTTKLRSGMRHYRVTLKARGKLRSDCQVVVDHPRTLDSTRFGEGPLATLTSDEMARIERSLLAVLGMYR